MLRELSLPPKAGTARLRVPPDDRLTKARQALRDRARCRRHRFRRSLLPMIPAAYCRPAILQSDRACPKPSAEWHCSFEVSLALELARTLKQTAGLQLQSL